LLKYRIKNLKKQLVLTKANLQQKQLLQKAIQLQLKKKL